MAANRVMIEAGLE